jgi:hypothetical protein
MALHQQNRRIEHKKSATSVQELQTSSLSLTDGMQHASRKMLDEVAEKSPQQQL